MGFFNGISKGMLIRYIYIYTQCTVYHIYTTIHSIHILQYTVYICICILYKYISMYIYIYMYMYNEIYLYIYTVYYMYIYIVRYSEIE